MRKIDIITILGLMIITIITAILATQFESQKIILLAILCLSVGKLLLVAFNFMELRKAHKLWKGLLIGFVAFFTMIVGLML